MKRTLFKWLFVALLVMAGFTLSWAGSGDPVLEGKQITGKLDVGSGTLEIPNSTNLPASCVVGEIYMDTDATSGQRCYLCESENVWVLQGDGGAGLWTDAGTYYHPNNWSYMRILDSDRLDIANPTAFTGGFPWNDNVTYGSSAGSMVNLGQESSSDGNPPLWVQKKFNKSSGSNTHFAGAGHFEVWKQSGATKSYVSALTGMITQECASGDAMGIHGRVKKSAGGSGWAGWLSAYRQAGATTGSLYGLEVNVINNANPETFANTVASPADMALLLHATNSAHPSIAAMVIGADSVTNTFYNGILFNTSGVRNAAGNGVGINMYGVSPRYGIKFSANSTAHIYYADTADGLRLLSDGHTISINANSKNWYWKTAAVDEMRLSPVGNLWVRGTATASCGALTCDYVFEPDYDLMTLDDLQVFVETEKELPGMTINRGGSYSTATLREELVEELEEQSLYILQLHERLKALETNYVH